MRTEPGLVIRLEAVQGHTAGAYWGGGGGGVVPSAQIENETQLHVPVAALIHA